MKNTLTKCVDGKSELLLIDRNSKIKKYKFKFRKKTK